MAMQRTLDGFFSQDKSSSPPCIVDYDKTFQVDKKRKSKAEYYKAHDDQRNRDFTDSCPIDSFGLKKQMICVLAHFFFCIECLFA